MEPGRIEKPVDRDNGAGALGHELVAHMAELTWEQCGSVGVDNARRNAARLGDGRSLVELRDAGLGEGESAIVIAAGPSIKRHDPAALITNREYRGTVIATDSSIYYCLRNGIVPDLIVTVDPNTPRILRWFGDPGLDLEALQADDYFRRQDMDESFADELATNREVIELLDRHGQHMRIAVCTSTSPAVVERILGTGMEIYWWNPMWDDPDQEGGVTWKLQEMNGLPAVNAGGNVGTACWMMADAVLGIRNVALTGMDFSYYDGTPYLNTQYYREAVDLVGEENLESIFMHVRNPHTDSWFFTDPAYMWYRESFLELAADADCKTYNCTGGGILFGEPVDFIPLEEFLVAFA